MNLYLDTEFDGFGGKLLSMALVSSDGNQFYEVLDRPITDTWVRNNVLPKFDKSPISLCTFQIELQKFLSRWSHVTVIADWPEDIAHFCSALIIGPGTRITIPQLDFKLIPITSVSNIPHNALSDAIGIKSALEII